MSLHTTQLNLHNENEDTLRLSCPFTNNMRAASPYKGPHFNCVPNEFLYQTPGMHSLVVQSISQITVMPLSSTSVPFPNLYCITTHLKLDRHAKMEEGCGNVTCSTASDRGTGVDLGMKATLGDGSSLMMAFR